MKTCRQVTILDLIEKNEIEPRRNWLSAAPAGHPGDPATVSRDIKELRLLKCSRHGYLKYATGDKPRTA